MLRSLLAERFALMTQVEMRQVPVYELRIERADRRLGPLLTVTARADCEAIARGGAEAFNQRRDPVATPCGLGNTPGAIRARGVPIARLAEALGRFLDRPVVDGTMLRGLFDIDLSFRSDSLPFPVPVPVAVQGDATAPALVTAVREQLGLKLEAGRGEVPVLVVTAVKQPTPD